MLTHDRMRVSVYLEKHVPSIKKLGDRRIREGGFVHLTTRAAPLCVEVQKYQLILSLSVDQCGTNNLGVLTINLHRSDKVYPTWGDGWLEACLIDHFKHLVRAHFARIIEHGELIDRKVNIDVLDTWQP